MITQLLPIDFLSSERGNSPIIDVRTPAEFAHGHIPGAYNVPIFSDAERVVIGTAYKQQGKETAMLIGLDCIGPRMRALVESVSAIAHKHATRTIRVHCWRGGMRSSSFAWLLKFFNYDVLLLEGGYKAYRASVRLLFALPQKMVVIAGPTGCNKTALIHKLGNAGKQVLDLEGLACHQGSVFGSLGMAEQPTQEQFDNNLGELLRLVDSQSILYIEDESRKIGRLFLPEAFWLQMRSAPLIYLHVPLEARMQAILATYGEHSVEQLTECVERLQKYIGGLALQQIRAELQVGNMALAIKQLLTYYDAGYAHGLARRVDVKRLDYHAPCATEISLADIQQLAEQLICM